MKIAKDLKQVYIKEEGKTVTVVMEDENLKAKARDKKNWARLAALAGGLNSTKKFLTEADELEAKAKTSTTSKAVGTDEFDPYIGTALALAYGIFGSKNKFHKWVKKNLNKTEEIEKPVKAKPEKVEEVKKPKPARKVKKEEVKGE